MEFEQMQVVWNSQQTEKLYAIDENALFEQIKKRGLSIRRMLDFFELVFIGVNFVLALVFAYAARRGGSFDAANYAVSFVSSFVTVWVIYLRVQRIRQESDFDKTMKGQLDNAIWRLDRLKNYGRTVTYWYIIPMAIAFLGAMLVQGRPVFGIGFVLYMILCYFGVQWEMRAIHQPNQDDLKSLRKTLTTE